MITLLLIIIEIKLKCTKNARKENKRGIKKTIFQNISEIYCLNLFSHSLSQIRIFVFLFHIEIIHK